MPLYKYDSFNKSGRRIKGIIDASSLTSAKQLLKGQGLMPTKIVQVGTEGEGFTFASLFEKKVDFKAIIMFTKQLAVLLKSGVPLLQAFELLVDQFEQKFRRVLINIKDGLKGGESLAVQLGKYPKIFPMFMFS
jgi:type II secretory pathway component PulF